jgi:DNA-binding transcriptional LysR family regulator
LPTLLAGDLRIDSTEPLLAGVVTATMERLWPKYSRITVQADAATLIKRDLPERGIELTVVSMTSLPRLTVSSVMSPPIVGRFLEHDRFVAVIADSLLKFLLRETSPDKAVPVELEAPPFGVGIVTLKARMISPLAQLILDEARDLGNQLARRWARYAGRVRE